jgi:PAP2 superfamily
MMVNRRTALTMMAAALAVPARAAVAAPTDILRTWYRLALELTRHTPTYSPPVASRTFAYLGVTAYEAVASGTDQLTTLAGQLNGLKHVPQREVGKAYDDRVIIDTALNAAVTHFFVNTGPTGQRAMERLGAKLRSQASDRVDSELVNRSTAYGQALAGHVLAWSRDDGGAVVENMGFPLEYALAKGPSLWAPTSLISQQQFPLLPGWGKNRTFAIPPGADCPLDAPIYSEEKTSEFYKQALEVYDIRKNITPEQKAIARFWSDDPMLSPTPPGHWMSIALQTLENENASLAKYVDVLARLGVSIADAFICCWRTKYEVNLLRPVTYIKRLIDPKWEALIITPPFPEYPSGHSAQSAAASAVLTKIYGENFAFEDRTHERDGIKPRSFPNFEGAATEAALSRLYGGIHYRAAVEQGLVQGRCVATFTNGLRTLS